MALTNKEQRMIFESAAISWSGNKSETPTPIVAPAKQIEEEIFMDFIAGVHGNTINESTSDREFNQKVWNTVVDLNTLTDIVNRSYFAG